MTIQTGGGVNFRTARGTTTRTPAAGTGTEAITGVGFKPKLVILLLSNGAGASNAFAVTFFSEVDYGAGVRQSTSGLAEAGNFGETSNMAITDLTNGYGVDVNSFDSDGFTLGWTKVGTGFAVNVSYLAMTW